MFARLADGGEKRLRAIEGQATLLGRTMHAIAYDPVHDEIVVPQQFGQGVLTFAGDANGETPPKRVIRGPKTGLIALDRLGVDGVNNEIYVPEGDRVLVFPREANGDVAPIRTLTGPATGIGDASSVAVDATRNLLVVAGNAPEPPGERRRGGRTGQFMMFNRTADGNAKPVRVITGVPGTRNIALYPERGLIFIVLDGYIGVYNIEDSGDAPMRYTIGGPNGMLREVRGVTIDPKNKTVIVSDKQLNAVLTYSVPQIFDRAAKTESVQ